MSEAKQLLDQLIGDFSVEKFKRFFREKSRQFVSRDEDYSRYSDDNFTNCLKLGEISFSDNEKIMVCTFEVKKELSERAGKKSQYEKAKKILKSAENQQFSAGIFIFYDQGGNFRFSLVYPESIGTRRQWNNFRRYTYFVSPEFTNKTFLKQIGEKAFSNLDDVKSAFSITAVTDIFYDEFFKVYDKVVKETKKINSIKGEEKARDFVLLFAIRLVFLGFIQKKKWIGDNEKFIQSFFLEYKEKYFGEDKFYVNWLSPLFFEALNSPQGRKVAYGKNDFSKATEAILQMAPFLNGGLFKPKKDYDTNDWYIPDKEIEEFFNFLFAHSFTIEENSLDDEDLQLNPEFLGIIFERLVNKADGAVYTPRTEVDLMCRMSLVKWLQKNLENPIKNDNLYELFFKESEKEEDQKEGSFSQKEAQEILDKLENLAICDPAVGSGAFLVGMMQVLDEIEHLLKTKYSLNGKNVFERKKQIIKNSLYGVEVKEWAVWICQLRLWLSLFVDAPDDLKNSLEPILPSLDFKVRQGDSLVQRVGSKAFPIEGHMMIQSNSIKRKITELKKFKIDYFDNDKNVLISGFDNPYKRELNIYEEILDLEIEQKKEKLRELKNIKISQQLVLLEVKKEDEQLGLNFNKKILEKIEFELSELKNQKQTLRSGGKPLIWSIEFAEVFAEKDGFDIIIGNPPYVRQEKIEDPTGKIKDKKEYKNCLQEMVKLDFPKDFARNAKINAQSDLYTYFYIRGLRLLNPKGIHTFICSNSWLDVGYGVWLQEFLLKRCPVEIIIDNHCKRSFSAADVNTIISIIHAPQKKIGSDHLTKFVAFKKPFEEGIYTENMLAIENAKIVESSDTFRVYPISTKELKDTGVEYISEEQKTLGGKYVGDKWGGKYLRAPDIFFTILKKGKDKLIKLDNIANVRFGIKTGANQFFYLTDDKLKEWKIEPRFIKKTIFSFKEIKTIVQQDINFRFSLFWCPYSKKDIKGTNASKYIKWGERQSVVIKQGSNKGKVVTGFQKIKSCSDRKYWYGFLEGWKSANLIFNSKIGERFFVYKNSFNYFEDKKLYGVFAKDQSKIDELVLILNTTILRLILELLSNELTGAQAIIDVTVEVVNNLLIPKPDLVDFSKINKKIFSRPIKSIFEECGLDPKSEVPIEEQEPKPLVDRAELDKIVFDALGLTEDERKDVYRAVCRLVWNRISKAKSV